jgi:hypothetical protein
MVWQEIVAQRATANALGAVLPCPSAPGKDLDLDSRIASALTVYGFLVFGVFLLVVPWTPIWGQAMLAFLPTPAGRWALQGWVRGLVSGLGAIDLVVAFQAAGELRDRMRGGTGGSDVVAQAKKERQPEAAAPQVRAGEEIRTRSSD